MAEAVQKATEDRVTSTYEYKLYGKEMCVKIYLDDPLEDGTVEKCWENVYRCVGQQQANAEKFLLPSYGDAPPRSYSDFTSCVFAARRAAHIFVLQKRDAEWAAAAAAAGDAPSVAPRVRAAVRPVPQVAALPSGGSGGAVRPGPVCTTDGRCVDGRGVEIKKEKKAAAASKLAGKAAASAVVAASAAPVSSAPPARVSEVRTATLPEEVVDAGLPPVANALGDGERRRRPVTSIYDSRDGGFADEDGLSMAISALGRANGSDQLPLPDDAGPGGKK